MKRSTMWLWVCGSLLSATAAVGCTGNVSKMPSEDGVFGGEDTGADPDPDEGKTPPGKGEEDGAPEGGGTDTPPPGNGDGDGDGSGADPDPGTDTGTGDVSDCAALGYEGACVGAVSVWFEDGACRVRDCGGEGKACDWIADDVGWGCMGGTEGASTADCATLGYTGACMGETLVWVEGGACHAVSCASTGRSCVWAGGEIGYDCE